MSRQPGGNGELAASATAAALKGAALIALAVIVGVFLLQKTDSSSAGSPTVAAKAPKTTTTVHKPQPTTSTTGTTVAAAPTKTPDQLHLIVLNGGAATGEAAKLRGKLQQVGYTNQEQANTWSGHHQTGITIMCKPGLEAEAVALSQQTPLQGSKVVPFPTPAPPSSDNVDCVIVVGS
jgi:hypothetical protein